MPQYSLTSIHFNKKYYNFFVEEEEIRMEKLIDFKNNTIQKDIVVAQNVLIEKVLYPAST